MALKNNYSEEANIYDTDWAWGAVFSDFNHDGLEDFYVANGFFNSENDRFMLNQGEGLNNNFVAGTFSGNPPIMSKSRSVVSFDYDNDGDLDLIVTDFFNNIQKPLSLSWPVKDLQEDPYFSLNLMAISLCIDISSPLYS